MKNEYNVVIVVDCSTCSEKILPILENMIGKKIPFFKVSIVDKKALEEPFKKLKIYGVIHFEERKQLVNQLKILFYIMKITLLELLISLNYVLNTK